MGVPELWSGQTMLVLAWAVRVISEGSGCLMRGGRDEEDWMSDRAGVSRRLVQDADSRHVRATTPSSRQQSTRRRRRRVCPPQGLTALKPCLETPATPQTRHVCAHCRRPGRAKHASKPRVECRRRRRRLYDASSSAVDAISPCCHCPDAMEKRRARDK